LSRRPDEAGLRVPESTGHAELRLRQFLHRLRFLMSGTREVSSCALQPDSGPHPGKAKRI
ncbi:MAG: hypothetical protein ABSF40_16035, partial [Candidatus Acidiferrales bacterium]